LAAAVAAQGLAQAAARLFGASETLRESTMFGANPDQPTRARRDRSLAVVRAGFQGETEFQAALAEGRALTLEQALDEALAAAREA
jgi:hypothetical protein